MVSQSDAPDMQSYPSPSAVAADSGPFYSSSASQPQAGLPNPNELQLTAQLSRGLEPIMNTGAGGGMPEGHDSRGQGNVNHHQYEQHPDEHATQGHINHGSMEQIGGPYAPGEVLPRKRSKVSRACDECRRKKIRCDATGEAGDEQCSSCKRVGATCQFSRVPMKRGPSKGYIKELADRLNTLEGAMQAGEIPVGQFLPHQESPLQRHPSDEFSPPPNAENTQRKRTFSSVSGDFSTPFQPQRPLSGWASQEPPRHLPQPPASFTAPSSAQGAGHAFRDPNYSPTGLQPASQWRNAPETHRRQSSFESTGQMDQSSAEQGAEWDEMNIDGYEKFIHPTYPVLPRNRVKLSAHLSNCPQSLKNAFYASLAAAVRSFPSGRYSPLYPDSTKRTTQLILNSQFENASTRNSSTNFIYLQCMILMAIAAENNSSPSAKNQNGPPVSVLLGSAVGLAYSMKLHLHKQPDKASENDPDSDDRLARRIWWSLVIMDRWHASSTASPCLIPDGSVIIYPEDQALLGEPLYHLARLSVVLGHVSAVNLAPTDLPPLAVPPPIYGTLLRGELERCRESFPSSFFPPSKSPLIHLCYWYMRILMELRLSDSEPYDLLVPSMHIITQLTHNSTLITPLTHHATALAALTLLDLLADEKTRDEAESGLKSLLENRIAPSTWDAAIREMVINKRQQAIQQHQQQHSQLTTGTSSSAPPKQATDVQPPPPQQAQGLQRLADLATATDSSSSTTTTAVASTSVSIHPDARNLDPETSNPITTAHGSNRTLRALLRDGYVSALVVVPGGDAAR